MERLQNEAETVETVKVFDERLFQPPFRLNFKPLDIILFGEYWWYMSKEDACKELSDDSPNLTRIVPRRREKNNSSMDVPTCRKSPALVWLHVAATFTSHFSFVSSFNLTHEIHLWYFYLYIWLICMVCVGRDTSPMDPMGNEMTEDMFGCGFVASPKAVGEGQGQQQMQQQQDNKHSSIRQDRSNRCLNSSCQISR